MLAYCTSGGQVKIYIQCKVVTGIRSISGNYSLYCEDIDTCTCIIVVVMKMRVRRQQPASSLYDRVRYDKFHIGILSLGRDSTFLRP